MAPAEPFWTELEDYLRAFHDGLAHGVGGLSDGGSWWSRQGEGSLRFSVEEHEDYLHLLGDACEQLAPDGDLSQAAMDSALKDAVFAVADLSGSRTTDVEARIRDAVEALRTLTEAPAEGYECWIEVEHLDEASLPAKFGVTRFVILGTADTDALRAIVEEKHSVDKEGKAESVDRMAEEIEGRAVAVQQVRARDQQAALAIAEREVKVTLECLNFFADVVPYNHARLRVSGGVGERQNSLQMVIADEGSFVHSPQSTIPWKFSFERLRELAGPAGEALARVDALLGKDDRNRVEELLLRAVRWVGRAVAGDRPEDKFLFSMVALDCITRPRGGPQAKKKLSSRAAHLLSDSRRGRERLETELGRLYDVRSKLVHDGSLEVSEDDRSQVQTIALETVGWALISPDVESLSTLDELEAYFKRIVGAEAV